ncbi:MAG: carboxypeptidase-like regulatory domain-containing protein, partial [Bacteroidota bacterium]
MTSVNSFKRPSLIILSLISLFLVSHKSIGQSRIQLSGMVVDAENSIPVPYAYVSLQDVALGTVTNGDGRFAINIPGNYVQQNIVFSYVGYERQVISITELQSREKIVIKLNPDVKVLREVVVKPRKPIKAKTLLKRVINRIPDNYPDESMLMNAYYRETITENGAYIKYADASVQYNYAPYKKGGFKWREYANAYGGVAGSLSRLNNYAGSRLHRIHFHQRTLKEDQVKIIDSRASADLTKTRMHANIEGGPMGILARDRVKFQKSFLGGKKFKKFNYELGEVIDEHGDWVYVLSFKTVITPEELDKLKKKSIKQWSKANSYKLLQGKIYIDQNDYAILKYECSVPNELKKYFCGYKTMAIKHFDYKLEATYKKKDDKYYIDKLRHEDEFIYTDTVANNTTPYAAVSEVYMTNVQPAGQKFDFKETLENIDANQLYDYPLEYNTKFWEDYTKNTPIAEIPEQIRKDMEVGKKLEQQFVDKHTRDENLTPPVAKIKTKETPIHGEVIKDDYAWLKDTKSPLSNQEVMDYIESENKYAENYFIPLRRSQRSLYDELSSRVNKNIESLPFKQDGYEYTTKYTADDEYPVYLRNKVGSSEKEVIMDVNKMAEEREGYYSAGIIEV